jgi:hypothetical protein
MFLAEHLGPALIRALGITLRVDRRGLENIARAREVAGNVLFAFWHGKLLVLSYQHRNDGVNVLVSTHQDGEYIARAIHGLGFATSRGSSTRGGTRAILELLNTSSGETDIAITPDGPSGPREICQPGIVYLAKRTGLPVIPVGVSSQPGMILNTWDRFMIPLPFARCLIVYGDPVVYDGSLTPEAIEEARADLEKRLKAATQEAENGCGRRTA